MSPPETGLVGIPRSSRVLADCGTSLPEQDATRADRGNPRRFHRSAKWKKVKDDFFHDSYTLAGCQVARFPTPSRIVPKAIPKLCCTRMALLPSPECTR